VPVEDEALASATFRFYEELNDFLPDDLRRTSFAYRFFGRPTVKDCIEAIGIPHTEVDLILVDGESVGFDFHLAAGARVAVYPVFEGFDISTVTRLRDRPLRRTRFILDVHLGRLARYLRLLGFDSLYRNDLRDDEIVAIAAGEGRVILTRDIGILKNRSVTHGYWLRSQIAREQLREVFLRFDLAGSARPLTRCMACNAPLAARSRESVRGRVAGRTFEQYDEFCECEGCGRLYWKGSHYAGLLNLVQTTCGG